MELRQRALDAFCINAPLEKVAAVQALWAERKILHLDSHWKNAGDPPPGRPPLPELVSPKDVPRRSPYTANGHAALMHSIAHIEFNAIALALDAIWRFDGMPDTYYQDWLSVAFEESQHFLMLNTHLEQYGHRYGDFTAHDGLWTLCHATRHDVVARMALVPRTLEARGLDATPVIQQKLRKVNSTQAMEAVAILDIILAEEVGHVAIGNQWYHWLCERDGLDATTWFLGVARRYGAPHPRPPLNEIARLQAGFTPDEMLHLQAAAQSHTTP